MPPRDAEDGDSGDESIKEKQERRPLLDDE